MDSIKRQSCNKRSEQQRPQYIAFSDFTTIALSSDKCRFGTLVPLGYLPQQQRPLSQEKKRDRSFWSLLRIRTSRSELFEALDRANPWLSREVMSEVRNLSPEVRKRKKYLYRKWEDLENSREETEKEKEREKLRLKQRKITVATHSLRQAISSDKRDPLMWWTTTSPHPPWNQLSVFIK